MLNSLDSDLAHCFVRADLGPKLFVGEKDNFINKIFFHIHLFVPYLIVQINFFLASGNFLWSADNLCKQFGPRMLVLIVFLSSERIF